MTDFKLDYANGQLPLSAREATEGPSGLDISKLLKETGHVTLDVGFVNTASCTSEITFIDGDDGILRYAHPMPVLSSAVSALSTFYQDNLNPFDRDQVDLSTVRLLAKVPTIASYAYKKSIGQPLMYADNSLGYVENFLRMTFGVPATPYEVDPVAARVLDLLFVLHADHEQNCSTSTVRLVGSSHANLFASVSAGVNALFGPLHGGAN